MFRFPNFQFDRLSFFLGFLAATLFWWVFSRFRPYLPVYWGRLKKYIADLNRQSQIGAELTLRREIIRRGQRSHVAAPLFALDEILVEPRLIAPPPLHDPGAPAPEVPIAQRVIPYIPDWPELASPLGTPTLTLAQAAQHGCPIAVIGQPGSGKSVALAHLAMLIARQDEQAGHLRDALPLFLHIADLDLEQDPLPALVKSVSRQVSVVAQPQVSRYLNLAFRDPTRRLVLLLDGVDELPPEALPPVSNHLKALQERLPNLQVIVAASSDYLDGLVRLGFYPLGVASWSHHQRVEFVRKWGELWVNHILPEAKKHFQAPDVDPTLIHHWLMGEIALESPLELSLKVWSAYAGDLNGNSFSQLLKNYFSRYLPARNLLPALDVLAYRFIRQGQSWLDIDEGEQALSAYQPPAADGARADEARPTAQKPARSARKSSDRDALVTQGERILSALTNAGILTQHPGRRIRFNSPLYVGCLAGPHIKPEEADELVTKLEWSIAAQTLRFASACTPAPAWISRLLADLRLPLCRELLIAARWLADAPPNSEWRIQLLRTLAAALANDTIPLGTRARMAAAFLTTKDPSTPKLFKQLLTHRSADVRRLAVLACGALGSPQGLDDILEMVLDPDESVRSATCLAISAIPGDTALNALVEILMQGDEILRQAAAEAVALNHLEGRQVLEELAGVDDLLTRRAVVFGLVQIRDDWARKLLEKIAVEDGQWVVRNAASQALEEFQKPRLSVPRPLPPPSENPWLLAFAGKLGIGIRPGHPATDVLMAALKSGSMEEQIAAMQYLRAEPNEGAIAVIYQALYSDQPDLHEPSLTTLWMMLLSGYKLPDPTQYGLG